MRDVSLTYFTCGLGEAASLERADDRAYKNVNEFIDSQAQRIPDKHAVGIYHPGKVESQRWRISVLTFEQIWKASCNYALSIRNLLPADISNHQTFALLCSSSTHFLFTWLALMRLGHPVLLLAPQCSPLNIAHLCRACEISLLFYDGVHEGLALQSSQATEEVGSLRLQVHCIPDFQLSEIVCKAPFGQIEPVEIDESAIAYLHHTSGTSTGIPKPIPQSHRAAVGVLPNLEGAGHATFTTTPLYHGGIADLFRAWTSDAMIWLFPGKDVPITAKNINRCLDLAKDHSDHGSVPHVKYFSSVPYVLQMMAGKEEVLDHLRKMDIVGVGGAALPSEVGDEIVKQGVNLISRFGSAECGFLMSSHRDYEQDHGWQFLRPGSAGHLLFEKREDGHSELIVLKGWPHMVLSGHRAISLCYGRLD
jgi:acyl-CoA synthetase (AMP-forming)/AMP-acid ligase II